ncbi:hypothetical protein MTO96_048751 [Rhipicephalus appendiculatus]
MAAVTAVVTVVVMSTSAWSEAATNFDASPGPRLVERDADGLRLVDWDLGCCERDEDLLSRRCAERDFGRRVCDRELLLRRLAGRDPERRQW